MNTNQFIPNIIKISLLFSLILLSLSRTQAVELFKEEFNVETPADWTFSHWVRNISDDCDDIFTPYPFPGFSVIDGILRAPNSQDFSTVTWAVCNSSLAYGSWDFDWIVEPGVDHLGYDIVGFIFTDMVNCYNMTGLSELEFLETVTGYGVLMISSTYTFAMPRVEVPGLTLLKYPNAIILQTSKFSGDIEGSHHVKITRNLKGQICVYFDSELTLQARDNVTTTSEKFFIGSFKGDTGFDNISIDDAIPPLGTSTTTSSTTTTPSEPATTNNYSVGILIPTLMILLIVRRKRNS